MKNRLFAHWPRTSKVFLCSLAVHHAPNSEALLIGRAPRTKQRGFAHWPRTSSLEMKHKRCELFLIWTCHAMQCRSFAMGDTLPASHERTDEYVDFPGAAVPASTNISFKGGDISPMDPIPCYRALRSSGEPYDGAEVPHPIGKELAVKMHEVRGPPA